MEEGQREIQDVIEVLSEIRAKVRDPDREALSFKEHLRQAGYSENTQRAYASDLRALLSREPPELLSLSPRTRHRRLSALERYLAWKGEKVKLKKPKVPKSLPKPITRDEWEAFLTAVKGGANPTEIAAVLLMGVLGLRVGEVAKIRYADIRLKERRLVVRKGKGGKQRVLPIPKVLLPHLRVVKFLHRQAGRGDAERVFPREITLWRMVKKYAREAGVDGLHPHRLRHFACTEMAKRGVRIEVIAAVAGHERIETTRAYIKVAAKDIEEEFDRKGWGEG